MNLLDIILLTPIVFGLARGLYKGLINELASLLSLAAGVFVAYYYSESLFNFLATYIEGASSGTRILAYALLFVGTSVIIQLIAKTLTKISKFVALGWINRILGGIFGGLKYILILLVLVHFLHDFISSQEVYNDELFKSSALYPIILEYSDLISNFTSNNDSIPELPELSI